jgi:hypothetical protein
MPRLSRPPLVRAAACLALLALVPAPLVEGAVASAAATMVEALPFVLVPVLLPRVGFLRYLPSLGCGCGGALPAAFALPGIALTWIAFGPAIALARLALAVVLLFAARRVVRLFAARRLPLATRRMARSNIVRSDVGSETTVDPLGQLDPIGQLAALGIATFAASLLGDVLRAHALPFDGRIGSVVSFALGASLGAIAPCATAGIGAAVALRIADPAAALGLLVTTGFVTFPLAHAARLTRKRLRDARLMLGLLAFLCAGLAIRGTHGLLNPRLTALVIAGGALSAACVVNRRASRTTNALGPLVPGCLAIAMIAGSPPPAESAATVPLDLYPGRTIEFIGTLASDRQSVTRAAILCCRADAQVLALQLDRRVPLPAGAWVAVRGTAFELNARTLLHLESARRVPTPTDPFTYL